MSEDRAAPSREAVIQDSWSTDLREVVARIIDPAAWHSHDACIGNAVFWEARGDPGDRAPRDRQEAADHVAPSLAKADQIIAAFREAGR